MNCVICKNDFTAEGVLLKTCLSCRQRSKLYRDTHQTHITQQKTRLLQTTFRTLQDLLFKKRYQKIGVSKTKI